MKFTIAITAFNRKENLNKLIDDLLSINFSSEEVNLYISIDGGGSIYKSDFDDLKEFEEAVSYIESFFEIIEDEASFKKNIIDASRTK